MTTKPNGRDHHDGLPNNQVRDLVADGLRSPRCSVGAATGSEFSEQYREHRVGQINKAEGDLRDFDQGQALNGIIEQFGWRRHDVSDLVSYDPKTYREFIGTDEERAARYPEKTGD